LIDFRDTPDEADFRNRLRAWVADVLPTIQLPSSVDEHDRAEGPWHRLLYSGGWVGLSWPEKYGGRGLEATYEAILSDVLSEAGAPPPPAIGFLGRALQMYGSEDQKERFLPGLLSGEVQWCQGFSEPDAGSDLASLRTRAIRDGDVYKVAGQKVWTSRASWADWCLLLVRTDPDVRKHAGISCLVVDMRSRGIEVRPLLQITGSTRFAEVFFDEVEVPLDQRIGEEGEGWTIAMTTVKYERGPADIGAIAKDRRALGRLEEMQEHDLLPDSAPQVLGHLYMQIEVLRLHVLAGLSRRVLTGGAGAETSVDKLLMIRTEQRLGHAALQLLGSSICQGEDQDWAFNYLHSRAASIYGGTEQIQKGIVATQILGLPRS
jgi:alkylation response protein AidB-like acyl-CoA dehydrogenase